ncbi:helix-turn-helix domain-containing protein [Gracilibacillus lacisalsi]|uniref:helix-turn-helix domain-containing protein n=1 Tax=Gracilibacillus lacisalsi TaxID=393087 RepID=UPI00037F4D2E|nr:helix-turn-helix transcriptional regulator [Gracilibacillus lacisalsi]
MTTLERIKKLCKEHSISVKILEERLDFPNNTIYQWKSRTPGLDKIQKVADYFNVSVDYLLGRTNKKRLDEPETLAAHHEGEDWTEEELEEIEEFKRFVAMRREARNKKKGD